MQFLLLQKHLRQYFRLVTFLLNICSRRTDGLHTRPYIAYIGADGTVGKPFVLPQEKGDFYQECMNSFNIPELVKGKVETGRYELIQKVYGNEKEQVKMNRINLTE